MRLYQAVFGTFRLGPHILDVSLLAFVSMACVLALIAPSLAAQAVLTGESAAVSGTVRDSDRQPLPNALVILQIESTKTLRETHSDANGRYSFKSLLPGTYTLHAESAAKRTASISVSLSGAETKLVDLHLGTGPSDKGPQFYDEPTFTVAGVSESSGAGVHASQSTRRNADALAKDTASLATSPEESAGFPPGTTRDVQTSEQLRKLIASNDQAQLHNQLGHVEENSGHSLEALQQFQRAAEMDPSERNFFDWGTQLLVHRAAEPAAQVFAKGNRLHPQSVRLLTGLAVAEYAQGLYGAAVDHLCQASDLDPHDPVPYTFLGRMRNPDVKRSADAMAKLKRYAELYPNDALANYYYAVSLWNQPNGSTSPATSVQVEQLLRKSLAIDSKFAPSYLQLGVIDATRQQFAEAASMFEKAIAADPSVSEAHYRLAQAYRRLGQGDKAQRELEIYQREMNIESEDAEREQKNVRQFVYELEAPQPASQAH